MQLLKEKLGKWRICGNALTVKNELYILNIEYKLLIILPEELQARLYHFRKDGKGYAY